MSNISRMQRWRPIVVAGCAFAMTVGATPSPSVAPSVDAARPTASPKVRVLVVGESQAGTLAFGSPLDGVRHGLAARADLALWNSTILACSISSAPVFALDTGQPVTNPCGGAGRWQREWATAVAGTRPDVVFLMAGARDLFDVVRPGGALIRPGDSTWTDAYVADLQHLFRVLGATGAPLVVVKPTCYGVNTIPGGDPQEPERLDPARVRAVAAAWESAARASRIRLLNIDAITCPGGASDPAVRADGVHFSVAGAERLAPVVDAALHRAYAAPTRETSCRARVVRR